MEKLNLALKYLLQIIAILAIAYLEGTAIKEGIDGQALGMCMAVIGGIAGYSFRKLVA